MRTKNKIKLKQIALGIVAFFVLGSCGKKTNGHSNGNPYVRPEFSPPSINWGTQPPNTTPYSSCGSVPSIPSEHCWGAYQGYNYCGNYWYYQQGNSYWQFPAQSCGCHCGSQGIFPEPTYYGGDAWYDAPGGDYDFSYDDGNDYDDHFYFYEDDSYDFDYSYSGYDSDYDYDFQYYYDDDYAGSGPGCSSYSVGNYNSGWKRVKKSKNSGTNVSYLSSGKKGYVKVNVNRAQRYYVSFKGEYGQGTTGQSGNVNIQTNERVRISIDGVGGVNVRDLSDSVNTTVASCYIPKSYCLKKGVNYIKVEGLGESIHKSYVKVSTTKPSGTRCQ